MTENLLSRPTLSGTMAESPLYNIMNTGVTDTVVLIGHADAASMYEPYRVLDIKRALTFLGGNSESPLLRALLEVYNAGGRDIWLLAAAPMSEYVANPSERLTPSDATGGLTFYQKYYQRLEVAYAAFAGWEYPEIIVPVEAVFYDAGDVDFATQLVNFCASNFATTGSVVLGVLGTRIPEFSDASIQAMANDSRLADFGNDGKYVMVVVGEGIITHSQMSNVYSASLSVQVAALLATAPMNRSIAGLVLPNTASMIGLNLTPEQISSLTDAKLNPITRTQKAKRGYAYQARLLTDNTLATTGSDFWSMAQMHIVANAINQIRSLGYAYTGTIYIEKFKQDVSNYLKKLVNSDYIRAYSLQVNVTDYRQKVEVYVGIMPIFGVRNIAFQIQVGPGA